MDFEIVFGHEKYFSSFYHTLKMVAAERNYLEMIEPPPFEKVCGFQRDLISKNGPLTYAIHDSRVIGWCDIFPEENPRQCHRGSLGMGLLSEYRGRGVGSKLLAETMLRAKIFGLEKVELNVFTSNEPAIALYKKFGFSEVGLIKNYRKLDNRYFDSLIMAKFL